MRRRFAIVGIVLLAVGVAVLLGRQWSSTNAPTPMPQTRGTQAVVAPPVDRSEPAPVAAAAPSAATKTTSASAEDATFRGRVIDALTRQPVREFEVLLMTPPRGSMRGDEPQPEQTFHSTDGRFAWKQAPVGNWNVSVGARHYQRFVIEGLDIVAGKATREFVMPLRRGHMLTGRVFDRISGAGIGDVWIGVHEASAAWPSLDEMARNHSQQTKDDGTFVLDGVPGGHVIVTAVAQDHAPQELAVVVNDNTPPLEIGLTTGGKVAGVVVTSDGTPAKGHVALAGPGVAYLAELDETGRFSFSNRPAGHYRLSANTRVGAASLASDLAENEVKEGMVLKVSGGRILRGAIKGLRPEQFEQTSIHVRSEVRRAYFKGELDEQGTYTVRGVPPGRVLISVDAGTSHITRPVDIPADRDVTLDIAFPSGGRLSGRVTQGAKPLADRHIYVGPPGDREQGYSSFDATTSPEGRYEIEGVPPGEYIISVGEDVGRVVTIAGDAVVNFDIPLVQIGGRVIEEGGTVPIVGVGIHVIGLEPATARVRSYRETDDFGQFRLIGVEPGELLLTVYKPGYEMHRETIEYSSPITNKTITLRKSAGVEVKLRSLPNSEPIRQLYLLEKMPGTDRGIGLWVALDNEGVGYLPNGLAGSTLSISGFGTGKSVVIEEWDGQPLELKP